MPDTNLPTPPAAPSSTTETRGRTTSRASSPEPTPAAKTEASAPVTRAAHFVLQGKGGVGKSLVASFLAQWLADQGRLDRCFDTDPVNGSFQTIPALRVEPVELLAQSNVNVKGVDRLIEAIVGSQREVVIDNGAASFLPLSTYLIENDIAGVLAQHSVGMVVHTVVTGGGNGIDTIKGLEAMVSQFTPGAQVVVWVNEFFGPARYRGLDFEQTAIYKENAAALRGVITLHALDAQMFAPNLAEMLDRKMTFAEARESSDFMLMEKSRLHRIRQGIWDQIARVL